LTKNAKETFRYLIAGIMIIYGLLAMADPTKYPIFEPYTGLAGLILMFVGLAIFLDLF